MTLSSLRRDLFTNFYDKQEPTHGRSHALRTMALARRLARSAGADQQVCVASAMMHQLHDVRVARRYIKKHSIKTKLASRILECLDFRDRLRGKPDLRAPSIEARVVTEADMLDAMGPFGTIRTACYYVLTKGMGFESAMEAAHDRAIRREKRLHTRLARSMAKRNNAKLEAIMSEFRAWRSLERNA
ncbi:hypothetical protein HYS54_03090 [Candidatus Micrarchaeota archaeon]|nr:hypothetical protein [Candidatus Micrarchaeota archaeon]